MPSASLLLTKQMDFTAPFESETNRARWDRIALSRSSPDYKRAFDHWTQRLRTSRMAGAMQTFRVDTRMAVGIGAENVLENAIAMHRLWGVPIIPGSSLKGLARHYSAQALTTALDDANRLDLFGSTEWASALTWLDAWYVPHRRQPFTVEVVTPHHGKYYEDPSQANPPWDFTDPKPSNYLSARGDFLVAVLGPNAAWARAALQILTLALGAWGIGAKTSSDFGFLSPLDEPVVWSSLAERAASLGDAISAADPGTLKPDTVAGWLHAWATIPDEPDRVLVGLELASQLQRNPALAGAVGELASHAAFKRWMDAHEPGWDQP